MEIKDRLRLLRMEHCITMDMLAYDMNQRFNINLSKGLISKWEQGKNDPSLEYACYLAQYFNVSLDYLIGLTDVRTPARILAYARKFSELKKDGGNENG